MPRSDSLTPIMNLDNGETLCSTQMGDCYAVMSVTGESRSITTLEAVKLFLRYKDTTQITRPVSWQDRLRQKVNEAEEATK